MNNRIGVVAVVVAVVAATAGLLASPSKSAARSTNVCQPEPHPCPIALTSTGPSPSTLKKPAERIVAFTNLDSVAHTVVFANGLCSLKLAANESGSCTSNFTEYVGTYPYTVDGKFSGAVITMPLPRSVTLTAPTHTIRSGTRLALHGQVAWLSNGHLYKPPFPVIVLARHNSNQPFKRVATLSASQQVSKPGANGWRLTVQPTQTTTYIAKATGQLPGGRGQVWANATSRPFAVRIRH